MVDQRQSRSRCTLPILDRPDGGDLQGNRHRTPQGRLCSARLLVPTRRDRAAVSGSGGARMERDQGRSRMRSLDRSEADWRLLLLHLTLGGFVVLLIGALATGATHYLERYMHPFFLLTPLWPAWARWTRGQRVTTARHPRHPTGRHYRPRGAAHCTPWARNATNAASLFHMRAWLRRWLRAASSRARSSPRAATMPVICAALPEARIVRLERPPYAPPPRGRSFVQGGRGLAQGAGGIACRRAPTQSSRGSPVPSRLLQNE